MTKVQVGEEKLADSRTFAAAMSRFMKERGLTNEAVEYATEEVGAKISRSYVGQMRRGYIPTYRKLEELGLAYGLEAVRPLFAAAGYPSPLPPVVDSVVEGIERIAKERGIPTDEVLPTLVKEALEDYG